MIPSLEQIRKPTAKILVGLAVLATTACSPNLVERAIDARGGALDSYRKTVDAEVVAGMPGRWSWEVAYRAPESFRWSLETLGDDQSLLFDGVSSRHRLGSALLPPTPADEAVRSQARWFAVTALDVLEGPAVSWRELPPAELPEGVASGLSAEFSGSSTRFELFFDERDLLARARGRVALAPVGAGMLDATFSSYLRVGGYQLPHSGTYRLDGQPLMRETVRRWLPNDPSLEGPDVFSGQ